MYSRNGFCPASALLVGALLATVPLPAVADAGHQHGSVIGEPGNASGVVRTVRVTLADNHIEPQSLQVERGETIRFVLINRGEFLHEFNIGTPSMHAEHQEEMAMMMDHGMITPTGINQERMHMDHGSMGMGQMAHDDPNSVLLRPGETAELIWTFSEPADLEFACNIPGHYEAGMVGTVNFVR